MNHIVTKGFQKRRTCGISLFGDCFNLQTFFMYENKVVYNLMLMLLSDVGNEGGRVNTELSVPEDKDDEHDVFIYV